MTVGGDRCRTGRVSWDGDGVAERLDPLWINWSCRLLRLVRLGWSQVCYAAIRRTGQAAMLSPSAPPSLLFWFAFVWPDLKQEGMSQNDELKAFLKDGLCTRSHWKGKAEILWWYYKIAEPDQWINPRDCISETFFFFALLSDVYSHRINFQHNYLQLLF